MGTRELIDFQGILTTSAKMLSLFELLRRVSRTQTSILVRGETGTGKELVAQAIHNLGPRANKVFRAVNCATFTPDLLASELFGHVRGAFTGAHRDRQGLFSQAHGGTLFLDEVAEIPLDLQARLLRVLQEQTFVPLGGTDPVVTDVRIISATHRALRSEVDAHRFREDLMYRIRVVPVFLPRLAEREGDVEALALRFVERFNREGFRKVERISDAALDAMLAYRWPGNVRELRNVVEYAFATGVGPILTRDDLTPELRGEAPDNQNTKTFAMIERDRIVAALQQTDGKRGQAAELLGVSRSTLWRKLREFGL
jgi:two-component system response regulator AtoC